MHLSSPPGRSSPSMAMITRRRLKTLLPVVIAVLLISFFVSTIYGNSDQSLLSRARQLYNKDGDGRTSFQANMNLPPTSEEGLVFPQEEAVEPVAGSTIEEIEGSDTAADLDTAANFETPADFETAADFEEPDSSNDFGPEDSVLDYDLQQSTDPGDDYFLDHDYVEADARPSKSLLDLMDFPETNETIATIPDRGDYRELFSLTTRDRRFIPVFIEGVGVYDANLIPHPTKFDMWIVLAQRVQKPEKYAIAEQIVCAAGFLRGVLVCSEPFENITMSTFVSGACEGDLAYLNDYVGGRNARLFYSPEAPYLFYGSQSQYTCSGMWLQDARTLLEPFHLQRPLARIFGQSTEVQRPPPQKGVEMDYFLFWDAEGKAYAHYDLWPARVFAQLDIDGSVGDNLAQAAAGKDQVCMAKYMPTINQEYESLFQASNSLAITLCERANPKCKPSDTNTYIMHIFHHAFHYDGHTLYEPHLLLFQQTAPFALHAISQRPFWIHGRQVLTNATHAPQYEAYPEDIPEGHTERFAIASISWKNHVQKYHGYTDDVIMLGMGIEDGRAGIMDVTVGDLLMDLAVC